MICLGVAGFLIRDSPSDLWSYWHLEKVLYQRYLPGFLLCLWQSFCQGWLAVIWDCWWEATFAPFLGHALSELGIGAVWFILTSIAFIERSLLARAWSMVLIIQLDVFVIIFADSLTQWVHALLSTYNSLLRRVLETTLSAWWRICIRCFKQIRPWWIVPRDLPWSTLSSWMHRSGWNLA